MKSAFQREEKSLIYLYDLPRHIVTSVKVTELIRKLTGYEISEPVMFRDCSRTGQPSPFCLGIVKVDPLEC